MKYSIHLLNKVNKLSMWSTNSFYVPPNIFATQIPSLTTYYLEFFIVTSHSKCRFKCASSPGLQVHLSSVLRTVLHQNMYPSNPSSSLPHVSENKPVSLSHRILIPYQHRHNRDSNQVKYSEYDSFKLTWYQKQTDANNHGQCNMTCGDSLDSTVIGFNMNMVFMVVTVFALCAVVKWQKNISATKCGSLISSITINVL